MVVRKWLWGNGFRYRLNHKRLPGKPDIVLLKYRTCIFVNGCFWHAHLVKFSPNESLEFSVESFLQSGVQTLGASGQAERESVESLSGSSSSRVAEAASLVQPLPILGL
jgi:hypothetical protein